MATGRLPPPRYGGTELDVGFGFEADRGASGRWDAPQLQGGAGAGAAAKNGAGTGPGGGGFGFAPAERTASYASRLPAPSASEPFPGTPALSDPAKRPNLPFQNIHSSEKTEMLRGKLLDVGSKFMGFDKEIEDDTVKRRTNELKRLAFLDEELLRLEQSLNAEIKRRIEANKTTQQMTEELANTMLESLQTRVLQRFERLALALESLHTRCTTLERG